MIKKRIFKKKSKNKNIILSIIFLFILCFIFIYYVKFIKINKFFIIPENKESFYLIPNDKGGEKVINLDKKSLNLIFEQDNQNSLFKPEDLFYSIQFYTNSDLSNITTFLKEITTYNENIYKLEDFFILALNSEISFEYFLLYKNFKTRDIAKDYCINFLPNIDNCLIVDTTKF